MEHPKISTDTLLQQLKSSLSTCDEIPHLLLKSIDSFEIEEDPVLIKEMVNFLLVSAVQALPHEDIDQEIFQPFMPLVKNHICKILSSIHSVLKLKDSKDSVISQISKCLVICEQILSDVENLLTYLNNMNKMPINLVLHLPKNVAEIVREIFIHCQRSKEEYNEVFSEVRGSLMSLFQRCYKLQVNLFTLLNEKVIFNCSYESELCLLVEVLDIFGSMSEVVADLDTMSLVAHWKGYAQLTQTYAVDLKPRLDVAGPIKYLSENISHQVCGLKSLINADKKVVLRSLKISSLQLKVLIKLCEHYQGYLGDCHEDLLNCVVILAAYTDQYLRLQGVPQEISCQVMAHIYAGAAPLVNHLISEPCFIKVYSQFAANLQASSMTHQLGYCNLTNLVLKKLIQNSKHIQDISLSTITLIELVFSILKQCSTSEGFLLLQDTDVYESLLVHSAAFIVVTCTCESFPRLEKILMKQLLQPNLWPAMFSSDLLCLVGRLGTSELCLQLTCLLHDVLSNWPPCDRHRPECVYVSWTLNRLISLLSSDHVEVFKVRFASLSSVASDISTLLSAPVSDGSVTLFQSVVHRLSMFGDKTQLRITPDQALADAVLQLWQHVCTRRDLTEHSHWLSGLVPILATATCKSISLLSCTQIVNILDMLVKACSSSVTIFRCAACELLRCLSSHKFHTDSEVLQFSQRAASLFAVLLVDVHPVTKQVALETFMYFSYVSSCPAVIEKIAKNLPEQQSEIVNFIEGVPAGSSEKPLNEYLKCLENSFKHRCRLDVKNKLNEDTEVNPCKKPKMCVPEETICSAIQRMEQDLNTVEEYTFDKVLNLSNKIKLKNLCTRIEKIIKSDRLY